MTDPRDAQPEDRLAALLFAPPQFIEEDDDLVELFNEIVARMRREAMGIPLETNQLLLLSNIATIYVEIQFRDQNDAWGEAPAGPRNSLNMREQWLKYLAEWNKVVKDNKEKLQEKVVQDFLRITKSAADLITNENDRREVRRFLGEQFAASGY